VLKVTPATIQLRTGAKPITQTFAAVELGVAHAATSYAWSLSSAAAASGSLGAIDSKGVYTPPAVPPTPNRVIVTATDTTNKLSGSATITLLDPAPIISSLAPSANINTGLKYTVDIMGSNFMPSYTVMLDGAATTSKFVSSTDIQISGLSTAAVGTHIAVTVADANTSMGGKTSNAVNLNVLAPVTVTVSPDNRTIRCGITTPLAMSAHVANNSNQSVTWQVNGITGGNSTIGTISSSGAYTPPADLPGGVLPPSPTPAGSTAPAGVPVKITAISVADPTASATVTVNLQNPTPVISGISPNPVNPGPVTLIVNGSGFAQGATVYFAGTALTTTFVSDRQLQAAGVISIPVGRIGAVKVTNPAPGILTSTPMIAAVQLPAASVKMAYSDAVKFLEMASWGPTPTSVAELQTMGRDAWLAAQFSTPASAWPDPLSDNEGMTRLQSAFFNIAMNGKDQLRQRVSFALAQIMVASGNKDTEFSQMVSYQRLLGDSAFGTFRDLLGKMTLNPSMGFYLDMVNNDKANPKKNTVANENYAREVMQLFTLGLVQLNQDGTAIQANPPLPPEYSQQTVTDMAKMFTGWTFSPAPGYASQWPNPSYYFLPMVPFDTHHDMTPKNISLPIPCAIPAGGSAVSDLNMALDCLAKQSNVAPFISYRLIQRLVKSNPTPAYVASVAHVFTATGGNLQAVVTAILTNGEATSEGTGKLAEPVLYATTLLHALNATVTTGDGINAQSTAMGQNVMEPGSVFSYFSPFYRVNGAVAPEFQSVNAATSLARANFAWKAVTNGVAGNVRVDLTNLQDLVAADPNQLVEAINQGLYRGEMTVDEKSIIFAAATGSTSSLARVRSAVYAAAAAPQYQVQQ
jgi:uncharacterized protein (DUF1800 family)